MVRSYPSSKFVRSRWKGNGKEKKIGFQQHQRCYGRATKRLIKYKQTMDGGWILNYDFNIK